jgi:hypothetical protein
MSVKKNFWLLLLPILVLLSSVSGAQEKKDNARDNEGWESVRDQMVQPGEGFQANQLVAAAYGFIWVMVAGFVYTVWRRTDAVEREIDSLRRRVEKTGGQKG